MQKRWIDKITDFLKAEILIECKERVIRENRLMLYTLVVVTALFSLMLTVYGISEQSTLSEYRGFYGFIFVLSIALFLFIEKVAKKRPKWTFGIIVILYIVWVCCIVVENLADSSIYFVSYYALVALSSSFLIKPIAMICLQLFAAALIWIQLFWGNQAGYVRISPETVGFMTCFSIVVGILVLRFRMKSFEDNEERRQIYDITTLYQSILDETQSGVYVRALETYELLYLNRKAAEIFELNAAEVIGQKCYKVFKKQKVACQTCPARYRDSESIKADEICVSGRCYEVKGKIIDWGGREAYVGFLTDVTDARKVSEQMQKEHESLERKYEEEVLYREKAVSEDILSTIRVNLTKGIVEEMRVGDAEGYEQEYRDKNFQECITAFCKNAWLTKEQKYHLSRENLLKQFAKGETKISEEYIAELMDGKHAWVTAELNLLQRPETNEVMAFVYNRDITRGRLLGHVIEHIMSFEYDDIYTVDSVSGRYEMIAMGEYTHEEQLSDGDYTEILDILVEHAPLEEDKKILRKELAIKNMCRSLQQESMHLLEVTLVSKNGKARRKRIRCMYLYEDVGTILVTITDIDDIAKAEREKQEQLEEALQMAREASRAKSNFLASMSHEIRTPMNAIIGLNSIIKENIADRDQVMDCSDKLDSASKYLLALLNDILDMSQIESGNMTLAHQSFDGDRFWENVNILAKAQADIASVQYIFEREKEVSNVYVGDATRLQQILINLINNAIKFTSQNGYVKVHVAEKMAESGRAEICVSVEDNGIGISEEFLPEVFDKFAQQHAGSTTSYKGSGLGLSIARNIAEMMDGEITVKSKEGVGTTFTVRVMLDIDCAQSSINMQEESAVERDFSGKKVLLAEDHPLNTMVATNLLSKKGFEVIHAENGVEAVRKFSEAAEATFDVILMDIRMPEMDGIEATMKIRGLERKDAKCIPIIAMTANVYEEDRRRTAEAGMNAHLAKPIDPKQLFKTLSDFID